MRGFCHLHDDLRRHPERRAHKRVVLGHSVRQPRADAEVREFHVAISGDHDVGALGGGGGEGEIERHEVA